MWIEHNGQILPSHAGVLDLVLVEFRDGTRTDTAEEVKYWCGAASNWKWNRRFPSPSEIVAYKKVER